MANYKTVSGKSVISTKFLQVLRTPHLRDIWPAPFLPIKRRLGDPWWDGRWDDGVVIEAGEPVGIVTWQGRDWLVPCVGTSAATMTYGQYDIDQLIEDIDVPGSAVTSLGASTATLAPVIPLGISLKPVLRNFSYSNGYQIDTVYENYSPDLKPTVMSNGRIEIPYLRFGAHAIGAVTPGAPIGPGNVSGGTLSATNRPFLKYFQITETGPAGAGTAATASVTIADTENADDGDTIVISVPFYGWSATYTFADTPTGTYDVGIGANAAATILLLKAKVNATVPAGVGVAAEGGTGNRTLTITSGVYGTRGNFEIEATGDHLTDGTVDGVDASGVAAYDNSSSAGNIAFILGYVNEVKASLVELGTEPFLTHVVTTPGFDLAGRNSGGVPEELRVKGNHPSGDLVPEDYTQAGYVRIEITK